MDEGNAACGQLHREISIPDAWHKVHALRNTGTSLLVPNVFATICTFESLESWSVDRREPCRAVTFLLGICSRRNTEHVPHTDMSRIIFFSAVCINLLAVHVL